MTGPVHAARLRLLDKLVRELAQGEHDSWLHCMRHARRLGDCAPGAAFDAIATHARSVWDDFKAAAGPRRRVGIALGIVVAKTLSASRHLAVDRLIDSQRAYRGTLLGLRHAVDCMRLVGNVAEAAGELDLARWTERVLPARMALLDRAEAALAWFAREPERALHVTKPF